jgi:hypothetical protein
MAVYSVLFKWICPRLGIAAPHSRYYVGLLDKLAGK